MKKFLSLLLALTMVLSLTVVPARADTNVCSANPARVSLTVGSTGNTQQVTISGTGLTSSATYVWNTASSGIATVSGTNGTATISAVAAGDTSVTCQVSQTAVAEVTDANGNVTTAAVPEISETVTIPVTVTDPAQDAANAAFKAAINLTYGNHACGTDSGAIVGYKFTEADAWNATLKENSGFEMTTNNFTPSNNEITIQGTRTEDSKSVTAKFKVSVTKVDVTVTAKPATVVAQGKSALYADATSIPGVTPSYQWKKDGTAIKDAVSPSYKATPGSYTCEVTYKFSDVDSEMVPSNSQTVSLDNKTYSFTGVPATTLSLAKGNVDTETVKGIKLKYGTGSSAAEAANVIYKYQSSNQSVVTVGTHGELTAVGSGNATITVSAKEKVGANELVDYRGYPYSATFTVSVTSLDVTLGSVTNGSGAHPYSYDSLRSYAASVINTRLGNGSNLQYTDVTGLTIKSSSATALGGVFSPASGTLTSTGLTYTAPNATIGKASITLTAATARGNFDIAYTISVTPISTTFETVTAEPITSSSTYYNNTYRVTFPTTSFNQFYVVNKTGVAPTDYSSYNLVAGTTSTTLNASDFNATTGTCTLFVIAWNSNYNYNYNYNWSTGYTGKYYCGPITVSQTNYNINYNGVAGETVQFKHADFTNFMNEVSQARGDASKTGSYPYVTFNYVTFNYPTSTQGTLYYNGTAMTNSSYSGSFNSRTQITNLDNVTFVPYARTNAKSIPLTFTLSVTKYGANGAVVNRDLKYTGTVAVSIVREDIKYTAAPGDTIRFTDSDFLNYLRTQNGFNSNYYSIDYVTFDQSAVNALNEGVLYAYSTGFNAVKTTDKFYYTTTSYNQNALSDVTFRASAYAKTGTTVYIPFTIYARYGTTGTGTRQVSGTVAIKLAQTMNFVDVKPTDYFYDSVKWAVNSNITKGTSATTFSPYKTCTRAEIVTFLWRAAGSKTPTITRNPFTDVAPSMGMDYYYAILWASQNGIAAGTSATTFSPNATCTRAQIVTFLWRYSNKPAGYYSNPFTDVNKAEHAAYYDAILWAVGKGITKGTTATTFSPYGTCTRGEAVTFLYRAVNGK